MKRIITVNIAFILILAFFTGCANTVPQEITSLPAESPESSDIMTTDPVETSDPCETSDEQYVVPTLPESLPFVWPPEDTVPEADLSQFESVRLYIGYPDEIATSSAFFDYCYKKELDKTKVQILKDIKSGAIPSSLSFVYPHDGCVLKMPLKSEEINRRSYYIPTLHYQYYDGKDIRVGMEVDAETLGDRYCDVVVSKYALSLRNGSTEKKSVEEMRAIAEDIISSKLKQLGFSDDCYYIELYEPNEGNSDYSFYFFQKQFFNYSFAYVDFDIYGYLDSFSFDSFSLISEEIKTQLLAVDGEICRIGQQLTEEMREENCDCKLDFSYDVVLREYDGRVFAFIRGCITPDNLKPQTHTHKRNYSSSWISGLVELKG